MLTMTTGEPVLLELSRDEAVVLLDWLHRFNSNKQTFEDQAEQRALWNLEALLESTLEEPFEPVYQELVMAARSRLRDPNE
jgi:hypothetical protein